MSTGIVHIIYLIHARMNVLEKAVLHAKMCVSEGANFSFTTLLMPRSISSAEILYSEAGLLGDMTVRACPLYFVPLEDDVLSLEAPMAFKEAAVDGNMECLFDMAYALTMLQSTYGSARYIGGIGPWADTVRKILSSMRLEAGSAAPASGGESGIDTILLVDRNIDIVTPMCTQLTYEGVLEEVLGMKYGQLKVDLHGHDETRIHASVHHRNGSSSSSSTPPSGQERKITGINSSDPVFSEARDRFFPAARKWLNETLRSIQRFRQSDMAEADLSKLKGFVSDLRDKYARLPLHAKLMERLADIMCRPGFLGRQRAEAALLDEQDDMTDIDDLIATGEDILSVLRLLCIYCAVFGGVSKRQFDVVRRDLLNAYSHAHLLTLRALNKAGLLYRRDQNSAKPSFPMTKANFKLLLGEGERVDEGSPKDIHFAFAGYAPLTARVVQYFLKPPKEGTTGGIEAYFDPLPGPIFALEQIFDEQGNPIERSLPVWSRRSGVSFFQSRGKTERAPGQVEGNDEEIASRRYLASLSFSKSSTSSNAEVVNATSPSKRRTVAVAFLGGVTSAELAAFRFMSRENLVDCDFVFVTTSIITGNGLMMSLMPPEVHRSL